MSGKMIGAAEFKAKCLSLIDEVAETREPVIVTKRGKALAVLTPLPPLQPSPSIVGALRGSVLRFDDPFAPVADGDWDANR
ncbi:type II toxin-antitoxin system Phd/YefM family antitoxin [Rhizobium sp. SG2393]|uniref:type II toxin-antitoxin system Phd/YefM family antitoxin n=1 Tax=Rhizobium sp. SG2393 TaxID=3276279 RepID=UPI00366C905F